MTSFNKPIVERFQLKSIAASMLLMCGGGAVLNANAALEEIIVTAQKREQSIQDIPFSVSALSGESLSNSGVVDVMDLQSISPSLMMPSTGAPGQGASFRLRGFGSPPFQLGIEPAVATFVDGVYRSRSGIAVNDMIDIDRIEVLKGPQGTLFGKNTTAGVIHIITKRPDPEALQGSVEASYEKYDRTRIKGMLNVPLADTAALRVTGMWGEGDGWLENNGSPDDAADLDRSNIRAQLLLTPNDDLDINLSVSYAQIDEICCSATTVADREDLETADDTEGVNDAEDTTFSMEINWQLNDAVKLTSITSYQDYEVETVTDGDFISFGFLDIVSAVEIKAFTQEIRFSGGNDNLEWTVGGFYSDEEIDRERAFVWGPAIVFTPFPLTPGLGVLDILSQEGTSYSLFGQVTYSLTDSLSVTAGLRLNEEEKEGKGNFLQPQAGPLSVVNPSFKADIDEDEPTGMVSLQYRWTEDIMTYVTYQHGYKAGGVNLAREASGLLGQPNEAVFDAETVDNIEVGAKMELWDNRVRLNLAYFHTEYDDLQNQIFIPPLFIVRNGEGAEIDGFELEGVWAVTDNLTFNFGLTLLDTSFDSGTDLGDGDIGGKDLPWAPDSSGSVGWDYTTALGDSGFEFFWTGNYLYKSSYFANSGSLDGTEQDSHDIINTQLGVRNESWSLALWCRNCADERVIDVQFTNPLFGTPLAYVNRPIEMGVTVKYSF